MTSPRRASGWAAARVLLACMLQTSLACSGNIDAGHQQDGSPSTADGSDGEDGASSPGDGADGSPDPAIDASTGDGDGADDGTDGVIDAGMSEPDAGYQPPQRTDGPDSANALFAGTHVFFTGADNRREITQATDLPGDEYQYRNITLDFALRCPEGGCDAWDRHGRLSIIQNPDTPEAREVEILRFMTPYGRDMASSIDVTDLRPLFTGHVVARVFIDTWVGPGHSAGAGWLVDATLRFAGGQPPREVLSVIPVWQPQGVVYGDPGRDPNKHQSVTLPPHARGAQLWTVITGHGQGNASNCAEFCPKQHAVALAGQSFQRVIWRDDCPTTAVPNQGGTWMYPRAGWCPGAIVNTWIEDVGSAVGAGGTLDVSWSPEGFVNTCRQGGPECVDCVFGTGCDYNGGSHTEPYYQLSALLVVTR